MRRALTVLVLLLSGSLSAQSLSDTIIQRERALLQSEHTGQGFGAVYLPTSVTVNQRGDCGISCLGVHSRLPTIRSSFWKSRSRCRCISLPRS
jgi:hypothetical protein